MAKKDKASKAAQVEVSESDTKIQGVIDRVVNNNKRQPNWSAFSDLVVKNGGPRISEDHIGIVLTAYKFYQGSPEAVAVREQVSSSVAEQREARKAKAQEEAERRAADRKVKEEAKAARDQKAADKAAKETAAAASKPKPGKGTKATPAATKGKATAKKAAAKKTSTKAAF